MIILIFLVLIFLSCESRKNAIYDLHVFRMELREHCADYSESDWNIAIEKYKDICERVDQMQLTREEGTAATNQYLGIGKFKTMFK